MAVLSVTYTLAQIEGITRNNLLKRFLRETKLGQYGTATSGSTSTIVDTTRLKSTQFNSREWVGGWARISKDAGGAAAAPETEISPITTFAGSTGTITLNPVLTAAVAASDEYELWRIDPREVLDMLDQILQTELYFPCWAPLSEVPDYDMEQDNTTDWSVTNATRAKSTSEPIGSGKRYITLTPTSAAGYAYTTNAIAVEPNTTYFVSVLARSSASTQTARLRAYDVTNSASIDYKDSPRVYWNRIWMTFTTPATCYSIRIQLESVINTTTINFDDVILYQASATDIALPWWVKDKDQVVGIFELNPIDIASNVWSDNLRGEQTHRWDIQETAFGRGQLRLSARQGCISNPLYIFGLRNETAYANDNTEKKLINDDLLLACLAYKVFSTISPPIEGPSMDTSWFKEQTSKWEKKYKQLQAEFDNRIQSVIQSDTPWREYASDMSYGLY